jgi:hypothetical protein
MHTKPFPPYGKELQSSLMQGNIPKNNEFLAMGNNVWHWAKSLNYNQRVLVLPNDQDPLAFTWPVEDLLILAFDSAHLTPLSSHALSHDIIHRTAYALLDAKARTMRVMLSNGSLVVARRSTT